MLSFESISRTKTFDMTYIHCRNLVFQSSIFPIRSYELALMIILSTHVLISSHTKTYALPDEISGHALF